MAEMQVILKEIIDRFGVDILLDGNRFCSIVDDYAAEKITERKILRRIKDLHLLPDVYTALISDNRTSLRRLDVNLSDEGMSREWRKIAADMFGYEVNIEFENQEDTLVMQAPSELTPPVIPISYGDSKEQRVNISAILKRGSLALEDGQWGKAHEHFDYVLNIDAENFDAYLGLVLAEARLKNRESFQAAYIGRLIRESINLRRARQFANKEQLNWLNHLDAERDAAEKRKAEQKRLDEERRKAEEALAQIKADAAVKAIIVKLTGIKTRTLDDELKEARTLESKLRNLVDDFDGIQGKLAEFNHSLEQLIQHRTQLDREYASLGIFAGKEKKRIREEIKETDSLRSRIEADKRTVSVQLNGYETKGQILQRQQELESEITQLERRIADRQSTTFYEYSFQQLREVFIREQRVAEIAEEKFPASKYICGVSENVVFGKYPQVAQSGASPIEWLVLQQENNRVLLISKYALDYQPFHTAKEYTTWETCALRAWLNSVFLKRAFTADEQKRIATTVVRADRNPNLYDVNPGGDTHDKVFLLSYPEAQRYFSTSQSRRCEPSSFVLLQGDRDVYDGYAFWILRSPGYRGLNVAYVAHDGSIRGDNNNGGMFVSSFGAIRPALWFDLIPEK